jgi:hypothetical protein
MARRERKLAASNAAVLSRLDRHEEHDDTRFAALEAKLSRVSGQLLLLIALVVGSGVTNWFAGH